MAIHACPSCGAAFRSYPQSRRSGHTLFRCPSCGLVGWVERDELVLPDVVELDGIDVASTADWVANKREATDAAPHNEALDHLEALVGDATGKKLYDVGAGGGEFLALARKRGWTVGGNDIVRAMVDLAHTSNDVELDLGDIAKLEIEPQDAITLWCVIAHVADPAALLRACHDRLAPGGVLFLQTPHRTTVDRAAMGALRMSRGRVNRWIDRRLAGHHWILQSKASMVAMLEAAGFTDVEVKPRARYSMTTYAYAASLGMDNKASRAATKLIDRMIAREWAPRIVLDAYARRP